MIAKANQIGEMSLTEQYRGMKRALAAGAAKEKKRRAEVDALNAFKDATFLPDRDTVGRNARKLNCELERLIVLTPEQRLGFLARVAQRVQEINAMDAAQ